MSIRKKLSIQYIRTKFKLLSAISKRKAAEKAFELFCTPQYRNTKALPPVFEKAEKLQFRFHQYNVTGYRWNKESERKVLILHGFKSSVINFERYVKPLIKKGYQVLAFDAPAHGRSSGKKFNVLLYKQFIETICKNYGPVQGFIAHSLGGLALSLALEEMPHDEQTKVVLIAPATETPSSIDLFFKFLHLDDGVRQAFDDVIYEEGGYASSWYSVARASKNIKAQVLWAHDKDDELTPYEDIKKVMAAQYPNYKFMITEGLGHRRIYRDTGVVQAVIDFF